MSSTSTCGCGARARDGYLCRACTRQLREALADLAPGQTQLPSYATGPAGRGRSTRWDTTAGVLVGGLADHLATTVTRQARIEPGSGGTERPLVFHEKAAEVRSLLILTLGPWARWLLEHERPQPPAPCPHRDPVGADCRACAVDAATLQRMATARWRRTAAAVTENPAPAAAYLLERLDTIRQQPEASQLHAAVVDVLERVTRVIDRPGELVAAGACGNELPDGALCPRALYADPAEDHVTCPACEFRWKVAERRAWLLTSAQDSLGTAATISAALTRLDQPVTVDRIYQWKRRGRLAQHGTDATGAPLYRLGDVVDLLVEAARAEQERARRPSGRRQSDRATA